MLFSYFCQILLFFREFSSYPVSRYFDILSAGNWQSSFPCSILLAQTVHYSPWKNEDSGVIKGKPCYPIMEATAKEKVPASAHLAGHISTQFTANLLLWLELVSCHLFFSSKSCRLLFDMCLMAVRSVEAFWNGTTQAHCAITMYSE